MIKKIVLLTLITFLPLSISNAEIIEKIDIKGNQRISDETIKIYG